MLIYAYMFYETSFLESPTFVGVNGFGTFLISKQLLNHALKHQVLETVIKMNEN